jgi:hypothetical protein
MGSYPQAPQQGKVERCVNPAVEVATSRGYAALALKGPQVLWGDPEFFGCLRNVHPGAHGNTVDLQAYKFKRALTLRGIHGVTFSSISFRPRFT